MTLYQLKKEQTPVEMACSFQLASHFNIVQSGK